MMFFSRIFGFDDVLELKPARQPGPVPFLDLAFRARRRRDLAPFVGPGLYGVFFAYDRAPAELVYVGKYLGRRSDPSGGDVVRDRWWAHAASLTMRGHRVSLHAATVAALDAQLAPEHPFRLLIGARDTLERDRGCQAGLNRALFAANFVEDFAQLADCAATRARFSFAYLRIADPGDDVNAIRRRIGEAEDRLIDALRPRCNRETAPGAQARGITPSGFFDAARAMLAPPEECAPSQSDAGGRGDVARRRRCDAVEPRAD